MRSLQVVRGAGKMVVDVEGERRLRKICGV